MYVTAVAKIFEPLTTKEEKWYGTKYFTQKIAEDKINAWSSAPMHERLHLPGPNEFIPRYFHFKRCIFNGHPMRWRH